LRKLSGELDRLSRSTPSISSSSGFLDNSLIIGDGVGGNIQDTSQTLLEGVQAILTLIPTDTGVFEGSRINLNHTSSGPLAQINGTAGGFQVIPDSSDAVSVTFKTESGGLESKIITTTGDPWIRFGVEAPEDYSVGIDNSDGDRFKVCDAATLASGARIIVDSNGYIYLNLPTSAPADGAVDQGMASFWYDSSGPTIEVKHKDGSGDVRTGTVATLTTPTFDIALLEIGDAILLESDDNFALE